MMTVRFPTGFSVQYNNANYVVWGVNGARSTIYDRKDGRPIAFVPQECIVEWERPCRTYNANVAPTDLVQEMNKALDDPERRRAMPAYDLAELKRRLREFNAKLKGWR